MDLFETITADGFEQVAHCHDARTGLRAVIAIHSTALGPALGGTRFHPFATETAAVTDVLRLARGMTYKAAAAGLDLGGGKAVIWGDPRRDRSDDLMEAYGRFVDTLGGRYVTAEDVGTTQADMDVIATVTRHVTGTTNGSGDPSPATARGVLAAIEATADHLWGTADLSGRRVVVSGVGKVGGEVATGAARRGALVSVADIDAVRAAQVAEACSGSVLDPTTVHRTPCDVFSPCALGAVLSEDTIRDLACAAVVGSANNQLATPADAARLRDAGIAYVPDYVANAGGIINIATELLPGGYDPAWAAERVDRIGDTVRQVFARADADGTTTALAADRLAEERLVAAAAGHRIGNFA